MNSPSQQDPWMNRVIGDRQRYRIVRQLDSGGMEYVFLAMDTLLGQQVALKILKETLVGSEELRKRFEREVALCAALKSDHIVGVTSEGHPFYVMEYLRGQNLGQLLRRQRLSVERAVDIVSQVCDGLQLAHNGVTLWRHGATASEHVKVVHRDLKPDNIFLVPTTLGELVKILDFGIARKIHDDSAEHTNLTSTVNRPLAASRQGVPDATSAQTHQSASWSSGGNEPQLPKQADHNITILQQRTPARIGVPDVTVAQIPPPGQIPDARIVQDGTAARQRTRSLPTNLLLPLGIGIAIGFVMMGAILAYMQLQYRKTVVDDIRTLKTQAKYEECITKAEAVTQDSQLYNDAQMLLNQCLMADAKQLAIGKDFQSAIAVARESPEDSSLHSEAQSLINQWTKQIDKSI